MVINVPPVVKRFVAIVATLADFVSKPQIAAVAMFITGIVLARGKRTLAAIARTTVRGGRYRGTVSRMTRSEAFRTRDLFTAAVRGFLELLGSAKRKIAGLLSRDYETWVLAIDDVATLRGGFTKIANGLHKRRPNETPGKKTRPASKSLTFVMGLLLMPAGARIPMPRKTWRTKEYAKAKGKKYVSKVTLAIDMVREALKLLPPHVQLVVVADALYDAEHFMKACRRLGVCVITSVDSARVFADLGSAPFRRTARTLFDRGRQLPDAKFERVSLKPGSERTASYRRRMANGSRINGRRGRRVYRVAHERRDVAKLGVVGVVYSHKRPVYRPRLSWKKESFKVLVCSDPQLPAALIVELYELRWQVEIFFRELKSGLGLGQYLGTSFEAFERLVDLTLLSYLFMEWLRLRAPDTLAHARLGRLKLEVERAAVRADLRMLERWLSSARGRKRVRGVVRKLREAAA